MDFNAKNFRYTTMNFGNFVQQVRDGKRLYLRALSAEAPTDQPANLEKDFPMLSPDFVLPGELSMCRDKIHSSILRVSGPVHMWLHFGEASLLAANTHDTVVSLFICMLRLLIALLMLRFRRTSQRVLSDSRI